MPPKNFVEAIISLQVNFNASNVTLHPDDALKLVYGLKGIAAPIRNAAHC